jgi:hypothetical protein
MTTSFRPASSHEIILAYLLKVYPLYHGILVLSDHSSELTADQTHRRANWKSALSEIIRVVSLQIDFIQAF